MRCRCDGYWEEVIVKLAGEIDLPSLDQTQSATEIWLEFAKKLKDREKRHHLVLQENFRRRAFLKGLFFGLEGCGRYLGQLASCGTHPSDYGAMLYCEDCRAGNDIREKLEKVL